MHSIRDYRLYIDYRQICICHGTRTRGRLCLYILLLYQFHALFIENASVKLWECNCMLLKDISVLIYVHTLGGEEGG